MKKGILNYTHQELVRELSLFGLQKFRVNQIYQWLYRHGVTEFSSMTNIGKNIREKLEESFYIYRPKISNIAKSKDGTIKFLLELCDQNTIETVFIPEKHRNTICVSSQVGCSVGCLFCNTGYNGFVRNLTAEEIIGQFLIVKDYLNLWKSDTRLSNVVFMGMGEPLFNFENVQKSIYNLMRDEEHGISRRRITVSTSGITPKLKEIIKDLPCRLAISLHAPNDLIRSQIMPINNKFKLSELIDVCKEYSQYQKYLKITFEYLLLDGVNDSETNAYELINLLTGINAKVNLLQFNSWAGCRFKASQKNNVLRFAKILESNGIEAPIRARRGEDIMAACGQLSSKK
ncbi:MAG: 23S rRNA (adenine(2503)-C(2))-methyltransferase RlmN [Alphaproteobacteria bacterium]|nr:23S rRNA (adenine(2503)-C(2))-methyltransferase RlmN [Alphaproteobacteria bacterium]